jgi:hypothetical protein
MQTGVRLSLGDLAASGQLVLEAFVAQLTAQGVTLPGRQYVAPGSGAQAIAWDGPQMNVALAEIQQGQPGAAFSGTQYPGAAVLLGQWAVMILRQIPGLSGNTTAGNSVPTAKAINAAASTNLTDVAALTNAAIAIHAAGTFGAVGTGFALDTVRPLGPNGALAGAQLMFTASFSQ